MNLSQNLETRAMKRVCKGSGSDVVYFENWRRF